MKIKIILLIVSFMRVGIVYGDGVKSFETLWNDLYQKSFQQKSVKLEKEALELSLDRSQRHWLPKVYAGGQWFSTNDPTQVFFSNLGQRSIEQSDFIVADLNNPSRKNFRTAMLGLDLPIYEGGMKNAQVSMYKDLVQASQREIKAKKSEEYAEFSRHYGSIFVHTQNKKRLNEIKKEIEKIIGNYDVGAKTNPVGYAGLLGLRGTHNRIQGMLYEMDLHILNSKNWINTKTASNENWSPELALDFKIFLKKYLTHSENILSSWMTQAQEYRVATLSHMKNMEKARYLPRIGLFAQENIYSGSRSTRDAQAYGVYFMWEIFNSDSYGRVGEAQAKALAAEAQLEAGKQQEKIMLNQLYDSQIVLDKNLDLLESSDKILHEQFKNSIKLFQAGMLPAIQLAEVINRRIDLIDNKNKVQINSLDTFSRIYQLKN